MPILLKGLHEQELVFGEHFSEPIGVRHKVTGTLGLPQRRSQIWRANDLAETQAVSNLASDRERKMFGGLAFLDRGRMCCGIVGSDLMLRIPDAEFNAAMRSRAADGLHGP